MRYFCGVVGSWGRGLLWGWEKKEAAGLGHVCMEVSIAFPRSVCYHEILCGRDMPELPGLTPAPPDPRLLGHLLVPWSFPQHERSTVKGRLTSFSYLKSRS